MSSKRGRKKRYATELALIQSSAQVGHPPDSHPPSDVTAAIRIQVPAPKQGPVADMPSSSVMSSLDLQRLKMRQEVFHDIQIRKDKYVKTLFVQRNEKSAVVQYLENLKKMTSSTTTDSIPPTTDDLCWWCCHPFSGQPCVGVIRYVKHTQTYQTFGNFCSWACVIAFKCEHHSYFNDFSMFIRQIVSTTPSIHKAMSRFTLSAFGGHLSISEYRSMTGETPPADYNKVKIQHFPTWRPMLGQTGVATHSPVLLENLVY